MITKPQRAILQRLRNGAQLARLKSGKWHFFFRNFDQRSEPVNSNSANALVRRGYIERVGYLDWDLSITGRVLLDYLERERPQ